MLAWTIRRFRWVFLGWLLRSLGRAGARHSVERARTDLEQRLPGPIVSMADRLPGDAVRAAGAAVVVSQQAKAATVGVRTVAISSRRVASGGRRLTGRIRAVGSEWRTETERARRRMMADAARYTGGEAAAIDALLDVRAVESEPLPEVPAPIRAGRRRATPELPTPPVGRVQRTYQRARNPWEGTRRNR